jgi:hypothetical protein
MTEPNAIRSSASPSQPYTAGAAPLNAGAPANGAVARRANLFPDSAPAVRTPPVSLDPIAQEQAAYALFHAQMPLHSQGMENSCGTTSLAMVLAYYGIPGDFRVIDRSCRLYGIGGGGATSPEDIASFARRAGLQAHQYTGATFADLETHIRAGRAVTVMIDYAPENGEQGEAHYVDVIGFARDDQGKPTGIVIKNPWGDEETIPYDRFMYEWKHVGASDEGFGANIKLFSSAMVTAHINLLGSSMIVYDRPENPRLPFPSILSVLRSTSTDGMLAGISGASASVQTVKRGHPISGCLQLVGAGVNTVVGGVGFLIGNLIGRNISHPGKLLVEKGADMTKSNFFAKLAGGFLVVIGAILYACGWLLNRIGGVIAGIGEAIAMLFTLPADALNRAQEMQAMLLNSNPSTGVKDPSVVVQRATARIKIAMLKNLLDGIGGGSAKDQEAALVVLRSCVSDPAQLKAVAGGLGGAAALLRHFDGTVAQAAATLLNPAEKPVAKVSQVRVT